MTFTDALQAVVAGEESSGISAVVASTRPKVAALMSHWLTCEVGWIPRINVSWVVIAFRDMLCC
jgi:hypothetical protein